MLCQRCRGLLVREIFSDLGEETARLCPATRCVNCGYVEDSVVRANRRRRPVGTRAVPRGLAVLRTGPTAPWTPPDGDPKPGASDARGWGVFGPAPGLDRRRGGTVSEGEGP